MNGKRDFSIQEVSQITGISVRTLRNYLKTYTDLLQPKRGYYNSLVFSEKDVNIFVMIKTLIKDGFKNSEIQTKILAELPALERSLEGGMEQEVKSVSLAAVEEPAPTLAGNESMIRVNPNMLKCVNHFLLAQERKNTILEQRLERIERLLEGMAPPKRAGFKESLHRVIDSTSALWLALKKAIP